MSDKQWNNKFGTTRNWERRIKERYEVKGCVVVVTRSTNSAGDGIWGTVVTQASLLPFESGD